MMTGANKAQYGEISPSDAFVFVGLLRCGRCGSSMQIESAKGRSRRYHYYNCRARQKHGQCENRRISARDLDAWLTDVVLDEVLSENLAVVRRKMYEASEESGWPETPGWILAERLARVIRKYEALCESIELNGKFTPNLADCAARLRANNAEAKRLEEIIQESGSDRSLEAELRDVIHDTSKRRLRDFFSEFIGGVYVEDDRIRIEYKHEYVIRAPDFPCIEMEARVGELRDIGLHPRWIGIAETIGIDNFLAMWSRLDENPPNLPGATVYVSMPRFTRYLRYRRNLLIETLARSGLGALDIKKRVLVDFGEDVSVRQIDRVRAKVRRI